jgi:hypothetical protein
MNKAKENILKLKETCVSETSRAKVREFILHSKKIYAILGVGIMICVFSITAHVSYGLGEKKATGYSKEYVEAYGLHVAAYTSVGTDFETSNEWAKKTCDLLIGK